MRFVVYGAGAIGGAIGGRLFEHGHDVVLIARGAHYEALLDDGLRLFDPDREVTLPVPVVDRPSQLALSGDDVVFLAMKTQDTAGALGALTEIAPADLAIVCAQNGVANERMALRHFAHVYAMCVMCPAQHLEPGVVEASSAPVTGLLDLGCYPKGIDDRGSAIAAALEHSTFESIPRADIMRWKYTKLLMNLGNAVEALCGNDGGERAAELARRARSEGAGVLRAAGIDAATREQDRERRGTRMHVRPIAGAPRSGGSSWQSLQRRTGSIETDYLNGEIVLLGRLHGIATPVNELLQHRAADAARLHLPPGSTTADELLAQLP